MKFVWSFIYLLKAWVFYQPSKSNFSFNIFAIFHFPFLKHSIAFLFSWGISMFHCKVLRGSQRLRKFTIWKFLCTEKLINAGCQSISNQTSNMLLNPQKYCTYCTLYCLIQYSTYHRIFLDGCFHRCPSYINYGLMVPFPSGELRFCSWLAE